MRYDEVIGNQLTRVCSPLQPSADKSLEDLNIYMKDQLVIKGTQETLPEYDEDVIEVEPCKEKGQRNQSKGKLKIFDYLISPTC